MTKLLEQAFARAAKLPAKKQNELAKQLLTELESDEQWEKSFATSQDVLAKLAKEARKEQREGRTKPLDPERL